MQQQLEGGVTLGAVDLQNEAQRMIMLANGEQINMDKLQQDQSLGFVPHKNLMPKTTGS